MVCVAFGCSMIGRHRLWSPKPVRFGQAGAGGACWCAPIVFHAQTRKKYTYLQRTRPTWLAPVTARELRDAVLTGRLEQALSQSVPSKLPTAVSVDRSAFAQAYEAS